jgi:hypothetical protein
MMGICGLVDDAGVVLARLLCKTVSNPTESYKRHTLVCVLYNKFQKSILVYYATVSSILRRNSGANLVSFPAICSRHQTQNMIQAAEYGYLYAIRVLDARNE